MEVRVCGAVIVAFVLGAFVLPVLRARWVYETWPIVFHRNAAPSQRVIALLSGGLLAGLFMAGTLLAAFGPEILDVSELVLPVRVAGWVLLGVGFVGTVASQAQMGASWRVGVDDRKTDLVTRGIFEHVRNPIYSALIAFLTGAGLVAPAWWSAGLAIGVFVGLQIQVRFEERGLRALHGQVYIDYCARVPRFIPRIRARRQ